MKAERGNLELWRLMSRGSERKYNIVGRIQLDPKKHKKREKEKRKKSKLAEAENPAQAREKKKRRSKKSVGNREELNDVWR